MRAIIGDEIRVPILWCEIGNCVERYVGIDTFGEWHLRQRALSAGWRYSATGRLACPACAREDSAFWASRSPR